MTAVKNRWPSGLDKKTSTEKFLARSVEGDAVGGSCGVVEFNGAVVLVDEVGLVALEAAVQYLLHFLLAAVAHLVDHPLRVYAQDLGAGLWQKYGIVRVLEL